MTWSAEDGFIRSAERSYMITPQHSTKCYNLLNARAFGGPFGFGPGDSDFQIFGVMLINTIPFLLIIGSGSISEPTTEAFRANVAEGWALVHGKKQGKDLVEDEERVVSPSRFRPLHDIDEEEEEDNIDEYGKETEEGEILESKEEGKKRQQTQASLKGKKLAAGSAHKPSRSKNHMWECVRYENDNK
ncbi:hypothetical protein YC2023_060083 [Brassica napus]